LNIFYNYFYCKSRIEVEDINHLISDKRDILQHKTPIDNMWP